LEFNINIIAFAIENINLRHAGSPYANHAGFGPGGTVPRDIFGGCGGEPQYASEM
jgi:hypothetical protein